MAISTSQLLSELNTLLRLTQTEAVIASTRVAQASSPAIARELSRNAEEARRRTRQLSDAIRDLGGVPNVVAAAVGRVGALAKTQLEQGQTLTDALLGDLALEHELRDRAHLLKLLAESASNQKLARLAQRIVDDHAETIGWIQTRLAEVAVGGPAAIRPTPVQATVGVVRRLASLPVRQAAAGSTAPRTSSATSGARPARSSTPTSSARRSFATQPGRSSRPAATRRWSARSASLARTAPRRPPRRCTTPARTSGRCAPTSCRSAATTG